MASLKYLSNSGSGSVSSSSNFVAGLVFNFDWPMSKDRLLLFSSLPLGIFLLADLICDRGSLMLIPSSECNLNKLDEVFVL